MTSKSVYGLPLAAMLICAAINSVLAAEPKQVTIALSFPNGAAWPYFGPAEEMGYFKAEGIKAKILSLNGSSASFKALIGGQADFAFTQPAQVLNGLAHGENTVSVYTAYQGHVYQFATIAGSPYKKIADLKGKTVGISSLAGGQYPYLLATLKNAGLTVGPGKDVEIAEVGRGGAAAVALQRERIAAYSASFVDMMAIELKGMKLLRYNEGPTSTFISDSLVVNKELLDKSPDTVAAVARAIAKGTVFCFENPAACWSSISKMVPDNAKKPGFTKPLLKYVLVQHELPKTAHGRWGYQPPKAWQAIEKYLIDSGQLDKDVDVDAGFTNELLSAINDFDAEKVKADARSYK